MRMKFLFIILSILFCNSTCAQDLKDKSLYSQAQSLDTNLTPDFYEVEVTISEYYVYPDEKRNSKTIKINIDSAKQFLLSELKKIGVTGKILLSQIIDRDYQSYTAEALLKASYRFNITSSDSIERIYKVLTENLPVACLRRFDVIPIVTSSTIKKAQIELERIALDRVNIDLQRFAERNKLSVQKIENDEIEFLSRFRYDNYYELQSKSINISFLKPIYTLTVKHTFSLK